MKIFVVGIVRGMNLVSDRLQNTDIATNIKATININENVFVTSDHEYLFSKLPNKDAFFKSIGEINKKMIYLNPVLIGGSYGYKDDMPVDQASQYALGNFGFYGKAIFDALWFYSDTSIQLDLIFTQCEQSIDESMLSVMPKLTNATGNESMSNMEIEFFPLWHTYILKYLEALNKNGLNPNAVNPNNTNRIDRAIIFMGEARQSELLYKKISMYIVVLECLFTTENEEVTHKVSERTAYYIATDPENRRAVYSTLKQAYDIRSKYVHGKKISLNNEKLADLSVKIDDIVRQVLGKIINKDYDIFTRDAETKTIPGKGKVAPQTIEGLKDLFTKLCFGISF